MENRLIYAGIIIGFVLLLIFAITQAGVLESWRVALLLPSLLFAAMLVGRTRRLWLLSVATYGSGIYLSTFQLHTIVTALFALVGILAITVHVAEREPLPVHLRALFGFFLVSVLIVSVRGIGSKALGSTVWGAGRYIELWTGLFFCVLSSKISAPIPRHIFRAVVIMLILSALPGTLRIINDVGGGILNFFAIIIPSVASSLREQLADPEGPSRITGIHGSGTALFMLAGALMFYRKISIARVMVLCLGGGVILGVSGYRSALISILLTIGVYYYLIRNDLPGIAKRQFGFIAIVAAVTLMVSIAFLPLSFQRMFAWVPWINIDQAVKMDAQLTTDWRIEMWKIMLPMLPEYLFVGRGLAFNLAEAYAAYTLVTDRSWHAFKIATHDYHSGPLFLLVDFGLPGLLLGIVFMIGAARHHLRHRHREWRNIQLKNIHALFLGRLISEIITFFLVHGALISLGVMFVCVAIMDVVIKAEVGRSRGDGDEDKSRKFLRGGRRNTVQISGGGSTSF